MQEISEPEYKNLTSLVELEKMKGLPLATSGNAASISSRSMTSTCVCVSARRMQHENCLVRVRLVTCIRP